MALLRRMIYILRNDATSTCAYSISCTSQLTHRRVPSGAFWIARTNIIMYPYRKARSIAPPPYARGPWGLVPNPHTPLTLPSPQPTPPPRRTSLFANPRPMHALRHHVGLPALTNTYNMHTPQKAKLHHVPPAYATIQFPRLSPPLTETNQQKQTPKNKKNPTSVPTHPIVIHPFSSFLHQSYIKKSLTETLCRKTLSCHYFSQLKALRTSLRWRACSNSAKVFSSSLSLSSVKNAVIGIAFSGCST